MLRRSNRQTKPVSKQEILSENLLYGGKLPPLRRRETAEEPEEVLEESSETTTHAGDYKVTLEQSGDAFLVASGSGWLFEIVTPEGKTLNGSAASKRKAERQIRKQIAADDRRNREEREKKEAEERTLASLLSAGIETSVAERLIYANRDIIVEKLPGDYFLIISTFSEWQERKWSVIATKDGDSVLQYNPRGRDVRTRRQVRKEALEKLRAKLADKSTRS